MASLAHCLKLLGNNISDYEKKALRKAADEYVAENYSGKDANEGAVRDAIGALDTEYDDILGEIRKAVPGFKVEEDVPEPAVPAKPKKEKPPSKPKESKVSTLGGAIKALGRINKLNFKGEVKELPLAAKYLFLNDGMPIDTAEEALKADGWLYPDESLLDVLRNPDKAQGISRNKVTGEGVEKQVRHLTPTERKRKAEEEYEVEAPPGDPGDYVTMKAEDLPKGKELTIIEGSSEDGWDTYKVVGDDPFSITLEDGELIELSPLDEVQVLKKDLGEAPKAKPEEVATKQPEIVKEEPKLFEEPARPEKVKKPPKEKLLATDKVERQETAKLRQEGLFEPKQKGVFVKPKEEVPAKPIKEIPANIIKKWKTSSWANAGYVLPDGTLLGAEGAHKRIPAEMGYGTGEALGRFSRYDWLDDYGVVRASRFHERAGIEAIGKITKKQADELEYAAFGKKTTLEAVDRKGKSLAYVTDLDSPSSFQIKAFFDKAKQVAPKKPPKAEAKEVAKYPIADRGEWYADADYKARGGKLVEMSPDEFLNRAKPLEIDETARDNIDDLKEHIQSGRTLDPLVIYGADKTKVRNADGRHRAVAAKELGIKTVPVLDFVKAEAKGERIEDFGEKIGGARKDYYADQLDQMRKVPDADIVTVPLSKSWPEPDHQKLIDEGADPFVVAFIRAGRDEIPRKPSVKWKNKRWGEQVRFLRGIAEDLLSGEISVKELKSKLADTPALRGLAGRAELYEIFGHGKTLKGVTMASHHYSVYRGEKNVTKWVIERRGKVTAFSNMPLELGVGNTKEEAIASFKKKYESIGEKEATIRIVKFDVYTKRGEKGVVYVGKQIGRNYVDLKKFDSAKAAREYIKTNHADLVEDLEKYKTIPSERREVNRERIGKDHRGGKDVTPEMFESAFGFRGVEFGNWVNTEERQDNLNRGYDALVDLATILDIPTQAISLNGELGLAFGARGKGGKRPAAAHYEGDKVVINLTRKNGPGSLAHEWFHALEGYFKTRKETPRKEILNALENVNTEINKTALEMRSRKLDQRRTKAYWSTGSEMRARVFENYAIEKLADLGNINDYLSNIVSVESYAADMLESLLADETTTAKDFYPYLLDSEIEGVKEAFDNLFEVMESKDLFQEAISRIKSTLKDERGSISFAKGANPTLHNDLIIVGKDLVRQGYDSYQTFRAQMKNVLGDVWDKIKHLVRRILADAKKVIANERGTFGGVKAATADISQLGRAGEMEQAGKSEEEIRRDTGWFLGPDDMWRYEIDDSKASLVTKLPDDKFLTLPEVLKHPDLYKAYPQLKNTSVLFGQRGVSAASFEPISSVISLNWTLNDLRENPSTHDELKSALLHEVQHNVQEIEGFARGGSPEAMQREISDAKFRLDALKQKPDYKKGRKKVDELWDAAFNKEELSDKQAINREKQIVKDHPAIAEERMIMAALRRLGDDYGIKGYRNLAGEIEARDVSARMDYTPAQRGISLKEAKDLWAKAAKIEKTSQFKAEEAKWNKSDFSDEALQIRNNSTGHKKVYALQDEVRALGYDINRRDIRDVLEGDKGAEQLYLKAPYFSQGIPKEDVIVRFDKGPQFAVKDIEKAIPQPEPPKEPSPFEEAKDDWFGNKDWAVQQNSVQASKIQDFIKRAIDTKKYGKEAKDIDQAIHIYLDTKRNPEHFDEYYEDLNPEQKRIADLSKTIEDDTTLSLIAKYIDNEYKKIGTLALEQGVIFNVIDNYVSRAWKIEKGFSTDALQKFKTKSRHAKHRVFETILEGQAKGLELQITGASNNLNTLKDEIARVVEDKQLLKQMEGMTYRDTEAPLISDIPLEGYKEIEHPNFTKWFPKGYIKGGKVSPIYGGSNIRLQKRYAVEKEGAKRATKLFDDEQAAKDYIKDLEDPELYSIAERNQIWERRNLYAPEEVAKSLNKILGTSKLKGLPGIDTLTKYNALFKAWILQTSFFHHLAFMRSYLLGTRHKSLKEWNINKARKAGLKSIKEMTPEIELLVRNGLTLGKMQDWAEDILRTEQTIFGKIMDKMGPVPKAVKDKINALRERQATFLFQNFGAGLKAQAALIEYRNALKEHPEMEPKDRAKMVANLINDDFGGLHLGRLERNPTTQHIFRLLALAPDWTESNVRTMIKAFKSGGKEETELYRRFWASVLTKGIVATVLANILMGLGDDEDAVEKFKETWEEGNFKWLAVDITPIYRALGGKTEARKYFSLFGHFKDPMKFIFHPVRSAHHKGSVIYKTFHEAMAGTDWKGHRFTTIPELLGIDDKGFYLTNTADHKIGDPKGGKLRGKSVTFGGKKGPIAPDQFASYLISQIKGVQPIQIQNLMAYLQGEIEGFDAMGRSLGLGTQSTYPRGEGMDAEWQEYRSRLKQINAQFVGAEHKRKFLKEHRRDINAYRKSELFQRVLNRYREDISELRKEEETPEIKARILLIEKKRTGLIKKYLKKAKETP